MLYTYLPHIPILTAYIHTYSEEGLYSKTFGVTHGGLKVYIRIEQTSRHVLTIPSFSFFLSSR